MSTPFKLTLNSLFAYLTKHHYFPELQKETEQICILSKKPGIEVAIFLKPLEEGELLQILAYLPISFKEESTCDIARLLHKLNHDLDLPGFGLNETERLVFYRQILPCAAKLCNPDIVKSYIHVATNACTTYLPLISSIVMGGRTFNDIVKPC